MINIMIIFVLSGLWHGANWTFVIWGFAHGLAYIVETMIVRILKLKRSANETIAKVVDAFNVVKTFIIVSFIWILFRASDMHQVKLILKAIVKNIHVQDNFHVEPKTWLFLALFISIDTFLFNTRFDSWVNAKPAVARWSLYSLLLFLIMVFSSVNNFPFIYFQF